jgi:antibiotic biosynthesis monooxygenase (ABM) superfamily enzyme
VQRLAVADERPTSGEVSGADDTAVTLVTHRKVAARDVEAFEGWLERSGRALTGTPGYLGSTVISPSESRDDWTLVQRFTDAAAARAWLDSSARRELYEQISDVEVIDEEVTLFRENPSSGDEVSVLISSTVPPALEADYLAWQKRISDVEAQFRGFRGHRIQRPVPGVQDAWVVLLTFDTAENLATWIDSPERARLLKEGERFNADLSVAASSFGFDFWAPAGETARESVMKNNLLVLAALYPIVFGWGYFVSTPLFDGPHAIPFWLSLFVGNFVSTQLLGWFVMPRVFKMFAWWLKPKPGWRAQALGFGILIVVYGASMGLYAWLLSLAA